MTSNENDFRKSEMKIGQIGSCLHCYMEYALACIKSVVAKVSSSVVSAGI